MKVSSGFSSAILRSKVGSSLSPPVAPHVLGLNLTDLPIFPHKNVLPPGVLMFSTVIKFSPLMCQIFDIIDIILLV
jgi:hypothetical protein